MLFELIEPREPSASERSVVDGRDLEGGDQRRGELGVVGALLNFSVALLVSGVTAPPPPAVTRLVEDIRIPAGVSSPHDH